jgi:Protein of unknown function (DUF4031)
VAVYVDQLFKTEPSRRWPYRMACHMWADTSEELDAMAHRLNLKLSWKQNPGKPGEHYDLTERMREFAVRRGVVESTGRDWVRMMDGKRDAKPATI